MEVSREGWGVGGWVAVDVGGMFCPLTYLTTKTLITYNNRGSKDTRTSRPGRMTLTCSGSLGTPRASDLGLPISRGNCVAVFSNGAFSK